MSRIETVKAPIYGWDCLQGFLPNPPTNSFTDTAQRMQELPSGGHSISFPSSLALASARFTTKPTRFRAAGWVACTSWTLGIGSLGGRARARVAVPVEGWASLSQPSFFTLFFLLNSYCVPGRREPLGRIPGWESVTFGMSCLRFARGILFSRYPPLTWNLTSPGRRFSFYSHLVGSM